MSISVSRVGRSLPAAAISAVGWIPGQALPYDEWLRQGSRLGVAGRNASWWVGDWLRYGTAQYGKKYTAAARVTGYDRQTLMNLVYVASRFELSRRRENLSWSHHAELAALDVEKQERWLDRASEDKLSVRDLREELANTRQTPVRARNGHTSGLAARSHSKPAAAHTSRGSTRAPAHQVECPECGHRFRP